MRTHATEPVVRPLHRVAKEMSASSGFLLAQLGIGFKAKALAQAEEAGFELYDYSILALLAEGDCQTQATIAEVLSVDPSRLVAVLDSLERRELVRRGSRRRAERGSRPRSPSRGRGSARARSRRPQ